MTRSHLVKFLTLAALCVVLALPEVASAQQRRGGRGFGRGGGFGFGGGVTSRLQLATLEQVQAALNLSDEQKTKVTSINDELAESRRELLQQGRGGGQGFAELRDELDKLTNDANAKLKEALNEEQNKRLTGIFIQVNGASALDDAEVMAALNLTDDQKQRLEAAREANQEANREAFQGLQDLSAEERRERMAELREESNKRLMDVLTQEQKDKLEELKGEEVEIDLSALRGRGRGGRGGRGGFGRGGNQQ